MNREITAPEVRLNGVENEPLGIVPIQEALRMAGDLDVDALTSLVLREKSMPDSAPETTP